MKQTIITILLALVAVAGQAQVKSSLDLCLRDEATGEWLIGLFDEYAIYDCNSRWDRYLGMTAVMTQVPVPTAIIVEPFNKHFPMSP